MPQERTTHKLPNPITTLFYHLYPNTCIIANSHNSFLSSISKSSLECSSQFLSTHQTPPYMSIENSLISLLPKAIHTHIKHQSAHSSSKSAAYCPSHKRSFLCTPVPTSILLPHSTKCFLPYPVRINTIEKQVISALTLSTT